jgi:hypothetical protein
MTTADTSSEGGQKMKTESENRMEARTEVQIYKKMLPTFQKVANRKCLNEPSYKNSSRFQREGSKLKNVLDINTRTTHKALCRRFSLLSERNNYNKLVKLP